MKKVFNRRKGNPSEIKLTKWEFRGNILCQKKKPTQQNIINNLKGEKYYILEVRERTKKMSLGIKRMIAEKGRNLWKRGKKLTLIQTAVIDLAVPGTCEAPDPCTSRPLRLLFPLPGCPFPPKSPWLALLPLTEIFAQVVSSR